MWHFLSVLLTRGHNRLSKTNEPGVAIRPTNRDSIDPVYHPLRRIAYTHVHKNGPQKKTSRKTFDRKICSNQTPYKRENQKSFIASK